MVENNNHSESKIRKVLFNEISLIIALVGMISGVIFWVANPQQDMRETIIRLETRIESTESVNLTLQNIKDNDLHELQLKMEQIESRQIEILRALSSLQAIIQQGGL